MSQKAENFFGMVLYSALFFYAGQALAFSGGTGAVNDPYLIDDTGAYAGTGCAQLQSISDSAANLSAYYKLTSDIDCTASSGWDGGQGFMPIKYDSQYFSGVLDGNGKTVTNLYIHRAQGNVGLFAIINGGAVINLRMAGAAYMVGMKWVPSPVH